MIPRPLSLGEETLALQLRTTQLPEPVREHPFCARLWRFDFAWPDYKIAVEVEGRNVPRQEPPRLRKGIRGRCQKVQSGCAPWLARAALLNCDGG